MGFEPGDIVSEVMSLGSPMPVEVVVAGTQSRRRPRACPESPRRTEKDPHLRDVQLYQQLDYPAVHVNIDRQRAGLSGVTVKDVTDSLLVGTSSSRYVAKNYWRDPSSGVDYQVQVQVPTRRMDHPEQIQTLPLQKVSMDMNLMIRDVAKVQRGTAPGQVDRSSMQRYLSIIANVEGEDLGRACAPHRAGDCRRRRAAARRARDGPRPGRPHGRDVRHPVPGPAPVRDRHPGDAHRLTSSRPAWGWSRSGRCRAWSAGWPSSSWPPAPR